MPYCWLKGAISLLLRAFLLFVLGSLAVAPAAAMVVVPAATVEVCFNYGSYGGCYSGSDKIPRSITWNQGGSAAGGSPFPVASAEARDKWGFRALYRCYFTVDGASQGSIPLLAYFRLQATSQGNARASAQINFQGVTRLLDNATDTALVRYQIVTGVIQSAIFGNNVGFVTLEAFNGAWQITHPYCGSAFILADPSIIIDPAYAATDPDYATRLTLRFSEGVVNSAAPGVVPEPAIWGMLIAGFAGIGVAMHSRRAVSFSS